MLVKALPRRPSSSSPCMGTVTPSSPASMRPDASDSSMMGLEMRRWTYHMVMPSTGTSRISSPAWSRRKPSMPP